MSISEKLTELTAIRTSMREKLAEKGIDASQHNFRDFPDDVESIPEKKIITKCDNSEFKGYFELDSNYRFAQNGVGRIIPVNSSGNKIVISPSNYSSLVICTKIKVNTPISSSQLFASPYTSPQPFYIYVNSSGGIGADCYNSSGSYYTGGTISSDNVPKDEWFYHVFKVASSEITTYSIDANYNILQQTNPISASWQNTSNYFCWCATSSNSAKNIELDVEGCYIMTNNTILWGKENTNISNIIA